MPAPTPLSALAPAALASARHARAIAELRRMVARIPARAVDVEPGLLIDAGQYVAAYGRTLVEAIDAQADALVDARVQVELLRGATCPGCAGEGAA